MEGSGLFVINKEYGAIDFQPYIPLLFRNIYANGSGDPLCLWFHGEMKRKRSDQEWG